MNTYIKKSNNKKRTKKVKPYILLFLKMREREKIK